MDEAWQSSVFTKYKRGYKFNMRDAQGSCLFGFWELHPNILTKTSSHHRKPKR